MIALHDFNIPEVPELASAKRENLALASNRMAKAWRLVSPPPIDDWAEQFLRLPREHESTPGRIDFSDRPYWRDILRWIADPTVREVSCPAATQLGKTLNLDIIPMLYFAEFRPAPGMIVLPDENEAATMRDRVYGLVSESQKHTRFNRLRIPPRYKWNLRFIDLGAMRVHLAWSGGKQRMRGKPCWYVWFAECDVYQSRDTKAGDPIEAGRQRTKAVYAPKHIYESSPSESPSSITDIEAGSSARYRATGRCPHCGMHQELRFFPHKSGELAGRCGVSGMQDRAGNWKTQEQARRSAHYVCVKGCKISNRQKREFINGGRVIPLGCTVADDGQSLVGDLPTSHREVGVHLWSIHSPTVSFADLAAEFLRARNGGTLVDYFGNWLGASYSSRSKVPSWRDLARRLAWNYKRREVPEQAWFLTAGADVQGENNGVRYVIRAWGPSRTSWLVDWGWIDRTPGDENDLIKSDLRDLTRQVLDPRFVVVGQNGVNPLGRTSLAVKLLNVDSNHLPHKVHHWLQGLPESWTDPEVGRVRAIRGDHTVKPDLRYRHNIVENNVRTGETYEGGLHQWGIYVYTFYDELTEMLAGRPGRPGSLYLPGGIEHAGREYLEQVTNFHRVIETDSRTHRRKGRWRPKSNRIPVDFWDCEIYALVAAHMVVGDLGWSESAWLQWQESRQPEATKPRRSVLREAVDLSER